MSPVKPPDDLSTYLSEFLEGSYDCMDRITINAFFPLGQTGGGIRLAGAKCDRLHWTSNTCYSRAK